jgi:putative acetyltransferase
MTIAIEDPAQPDIVALLEHGEAEAARLYPAESNHMLPLDALRAPHVLFHVARGADGAALATGAVVLNGDWAEIKRMWVEPQARGQGLSKAILGRLEQQAHAHGVRWLRLETGIDSHAALGLYARAGFVAREPFADYRPDPLSVFLEKDLAADLTTAETTASA